MKKALYLFFMLSVPAIIIGCGNRASSWKYACVTPIGDVTITNETDTGIKLENGVLRATRQGKSIMIPFSQCVGLKD